MIAEGGKARRLCVSSAQRRIWMRDCAQETSRGPGLSSKGVGRWENWPMERLSRRQPKNAIAQVFPIAAHNHRGS